MGKDRGRLNFDFDVSVGLLRVQLLLGFLILFREGNDKHMGY